MLKNAKILATGAKSAAIAISIGLIVVACQGLQPTPDYDGRALYMGYCAACHGPMGAGDGPLAGQLLVGMDDLRLLEQRNRGVFPREHVIAEIDGRTMRPIHGTADMPIWGWQWRRDEGLDAQGRRNVEARIRALVDYLESIQITE
jgi:mono/diheme cytochrome c family protein